MNRTLAIDTASDRIAVAVDHGAGEVMSLARDARQDHSRSLLSAIRDLYGEGPFAFASIAVVVGPGSYAGLRVGIATARGLGLALSTTVVGIGTLDAVAAAWGQPKGTAIHPIGRGEYAALDLEDGAPVGPLRIASAEQLAGRALAGEGAVLLGGHEVPSEARCRAALALALALARNSQGVGVPALEAIYMREPNITRVRRTTANA